MVEPLAGRGDEAALIGEVGESFHARVAVYVPFPPPVAVEEDTDEDGDTDSDADGDGYLACDGEAVTSRKGT